MEKIRILNLSKRYGKVLAVDSVTFSVEDKEFFSLLGPSGCGKSTVLRCVAGLEEPTEGEIYIGQTRVNSTVDGINVPTELRPIGMVFQNYAVWPHMTVYENIAYPLKIKKLPKELIQAKLKVALHTVGLERLADRYPSQLSGGEQQRIRLASQIGTGLTGVLYVLDEPSIGLHPKDVAALIESLRHLVELGNTLLVVEHDEETIRAADHIIELGPLAGVGGGKIIAEGDLAKIMDNSSSLTGKYLAGKKTIPLRKHTLNNKLKVSVLGARENNLKNISVDFPLGNLIGVTGVSGSGKSTLITETLYPLLKYYSQGTYQDHIGLHDRLEGYQHVKSTYLVDQSPIGRTPRSNPATYVGFFDDIRALFAETESARLLGYKKGRFSFNVKGGRCEKCQGGGVIKIEMQFLPDVYVDCDICQGKRYNTETLGIKYKGKTIHDILTMTLSDAASFFRNHPSIFKKLNLLNEVGLGYLTVGQPAPTLSGGEAQRIKLASELTHKNIGGAVYILDEPTTGLHFYDIEKLLETLGRLVKAGNTVIVIEHNLDVIKNCDWLIDLGPDGGDAGGKLIYQGPTADILTHKSSHTANFLQKHLS